MNAIDTTIDKAIRAAATTITLQGVGKSYDKAPRAAASPPCCG